MKKNVKAKVRCLEDNKLETKWMDEEIAKVYRDLLANEYKDKKFYVDYKSNWRNKK
jgi:hypothetical protein